MLNFISSSEKTVILNATNVGYKMNGISNYTLNLIKQFVRLDSRVNFIVYFNKSCKVHVEDLFFPHNFKVRWVSKWLSPDKKFFGHLLRLIYSNHLAIKHLKQLQFNTSPLEVCFYKKNQIVTVHDVIPILFKEQHKKQYHFYKVILKYVLRNVKMVITPSLYTKQLVHKYYELEDGKVKNIPLAINIPSMKFERLEEQQSPYILYVGRINEMKNVSQIIKSYIIVKCSLDVDLVIVGDDKDKFNKLLNEAKCNDDIKKRIKFYQNVSEVEKNKLMKTAALFIYPTLYEGFGFPPLEAMSNGCPVIVSNNSSFPEVCAEAAYYVNPKDENEIASRIIEILTNNTLKSELIRRGLERVNLFTWKETVLEHLMIIKNILFDSTELSHPKLLVQKPLILREGKS